MVQAVLLALIAGYADTVGYIRFKAFAGLMTGNTIFFGVELAGQQWQAASYHATLIAAFLVGVVAAQAALRLGAPTWAALGATACLLVLCGFLKNDTASLVLPLAMGLQNSAVNRFNGVALNTVFVTGNLQKVGEGIVGWFWHLLDGRRGQYNEFAIYGFVWLSYAFGAVAGALAERAMVYPLLIPAIILPFVMAPWIAKRFKSQ